MFSSNTGVMCDSNKARRSSCHECHAPALEHRAPNGVAIRTRRGKLTLDQTYIGRAPQPLFSMTGGNSMAMDLDTTDFKIVNSVFNQNTP